MSPADLFFHSMLRFPFWWYSIVPLFLLKFSKRLVLVVDQSTATSLMLRYIFVPLFGDPTIFGFIFGLIFRSIRVILGTFAIILSLFLALSFLVFWLVFPFILASKINILIFLFAILLSAFIKGIFDVLRLNLAEKRLLSFSDDVLQRLELSDIAKAKKEEKKIVEDWLNSKWDREHPAYFWEDRYQFGEIGGINRAWTGRVTPNLDQFSQDLTKEASYLRGNRIVIREDINERIIRVLEKESGNNVLLVGPTGCGKTTIVAGLALQILKGSSSVSLFGKRLVSLEIGALVSGTKTSGELEERMQAVMHDIEASRNILLFIDEIHNAIAAGGGGVDTSLIFSALEPHLGNGRFQLIGATSWESYRKYIEPNEAFARLFELVEVSEATQDESLQVLELVAEKLERKYGVKITYPALKNAIDLSSRFIYERSLPDKAIAVLEESVVLVSKSKRRDKTVIASDIASLITEKTHIPVSQIGEDEAKKLLGLEEKMRGRLIGQEEAIQATANAIRRARVGLRDPKRPIASLLFVGPTGVGKTEAAKTLAESFFGHEDALISFDMSEYQREDSVNRLLGSPSAAGQSEQLGLLTEKIRHNPYSLVLFDEVEKAHPRILDLFLQVLEEGRLTGAGGTVSNFANTIVIFTSNAGTDLIYKSLKEGRSIGDIGKDIYTLLQGSFRVELLNRFDGIIVFGPLNLANVSRIVRLKLKAVARLLEDKEIKVVFSDALIESIAKMGFDPALGARPLRRIIQDKIESSLAKRLLKGDLHAGETLNLGPELLSE